MPNLKKYLPECLQEIEEFKVIGDIEGSEIEGVREGLEQLLEDQFVVTSSQQGVKRREEMLNIRADSSVEDLDFRRKRIINRYSTKPPFTVRYLQERLDYLVGRGLTDVDVDEGNYTLTITTPIEDASIFKEVENTVKTMMPANLVYNQKTSLNDTITLEEKLVMQELDRQTLLGAWHLGESPFAELKPEVVIK